VHLKSRSEKKNDPKTLELCPSLRYAPCRVWRSSRCLLRRRICLAEIANRWNPWRLDDAGRMVFKTQSKKLVSRQLPSYLDGRFLGRGSVGLGTVESKFGAPRASAQGWKADEG
jgi:hypothetical protein